MNIPASTSAFVRFQSKHVMRGEPPFCRAFRVSGCFTILRAALFRPACVDATAIENRNNEGYRYGRPQPDGRCSIHTVDARRRATNAGSARPLRLLPRMWLCRKRIHECHLLCRRQDNRNHTRNVRAPLRLDRTHRGHQNDRTQRPIPNSRMIPGGIGALIAGREQVSPATTGDASQWAKCVRR